MRKQRGQFPTSTMHSIGFKHTWNKRIILKATLDNITLVKLLIIVDEREKMFAMYLEIESKIIDEMS